MLILTATVVAMVASIVVPTDEAIMLLTPRTAVVRPILATVVAMVAVVIGFITGTTATGMASGPPRVQ